MFASRARPTIESRSVLFSSILPSLLALASLSCIASCTGEIPGDGKPGGGASETGGGDGSTTTPASDAFPGVLDAAIGDDASGLDDSSTTTDAGAIDSGAIDSGAATDARPDSGAVFPHVNSLPKDADYVEGTLVITKGGDYTFNRKSSNTDRAVVDIQTTEKVRLINCNMKGAGRLIESWGSLTDLEVINCRGFVLPQTTPTSSTYVERRFASVSNVKRLIVENCYLEGTAGIVVDQRYRGTKSAGDGLRIRYNQAVDIDGRVKRSDGSSGKDLVQFFQLRGTPHGMPNSEIAYNYVHNHPDRSAVEDNINFFRGRGHSDSRILVHHNLIVGAYAVPASSDRYTGGGIISDSHFDQSVLDSYRAETGDASLTAAVIASAYIDIYENRTVALQNYNYGIASGNNIRVTNNRAINAALLPDGTFYKTWNSGIWGFDYYEYNESAPPMTFSNVMTKNYLAVTGQNGGWRANNGTWPYPDGDYTSGGKVDRTGNTEIDATVTKAMERAEITAWTTTDIAGRAIGVNGVISPQIH